MCISICILYSVHYYLPYDIYYSSSMFHYFPWPLPTYYTHLHRPLNCLRILQNFSHLHSSNCLRILQENFQLQACNFCALRQSATAATTSAPCCRGDRNASLGVDASHPLADAGWLKLRLSGEANREAATAALHLGERFTCSSACSWSSDG